MNSIPLQKFNDDLLLSEPERKLALQRFPAIAHVLDFPELRALFSDYEVPANRAKIARQRAGLWAILLGAAALVGASLTTHLDALSPLFRLLAGGAAILGILSVLIASVGALTGKPKQRWLCARLMTERLRQFQFQLLVCRAHEILASSSDEAARERFRAARHGWLAEFRLTHEGHLPARLRAVLEDESETDFRLHPCAAHGPLPGGNGTLAEIFAAYRLLRFEHQRQYADYKLRTDDSIISSSAPRQMQLLRDTGLILILFVFAAHFAVAVSVMTHWQGFLVLHVAIILAVIGILALHTLAEGLQPGREVERFLRYRSTMQSLLQQFDATEQPQEKLRLMQEAERASYQEMRGFLRTNNDARYVL